MCLNIYFLYSWFNCYFKMKQNVISLGYVSKKAANEIQTHACTNHNIRILDQGRSNDQSATMWQNKGNRTVFWNNGWLTFWAKGKGRPFFRETTLKFQLSTMTLKAWNLKPTCGLVIKSVCLALSRLGFDSLAKSHQRTFKVGIHSFLAWRLALEG